MSSIDPNDPILTAYVLNELNDSQRAIVAEALANDSTLRQLVDEIREAAASLESELHSEPAPSLTEEQRAFLASRIEPTAEPSSFSIQRTVWWAGGITAAAALVMLSVVFSGYFQTDEQSTRTLTLDERGNLEDRSRSRMITADEMSDADALGAMLKQLGSREDAQGGAVRRDRTLGETASSSNEQTERGAGQHLMRSADSNVRDELRSGERLFSSPALSDLQSPPPPSASPGRIMTVFGGGGGSGSGEPAPSQTRSQERLREAQDARQQEGANTENYQLIVENSFIVPRGERALSTFSIDVDTASYTNTRRFLEAGQLPPPDAVRIEELLNYFRYDDPVPADGEPFAVQLEAGPAPWKPDHRLVRIGLRGQDIDLADRPPTNLVFLIDVSGSMNHQNKLPLLKKAFSMLVDSLTPDDRVAMVVYAGASGLALPSTFAYHRESIFHAIDSLSAGGSTNGGAGVELAYRVAQEHFIEGGINRVILATDGDFNVGVSSDGDLVRLIEEKRRTGIFLSVLGFGTGNLQDAKMEQLADKGNGHYSYIDSVAEAKRVLVDELGGTLVTIAKDVKVQVEFNPAQVAAYRLIGYENRLLAAEDFADESKDAGELGAGMSVTALYEVVPVGVPFEGRVVEDLKYQPREGTEEVAEERGPQSDELLTVQLRYKLPEGDESILLAFPLVDGGKKLDATSDDFRFAASVAAFGMLLRDSIHRAEASWSMVYDLARHARGRDLGASREAFQELVKKAAALHGETPSLDDGSQ